MRNPWARRVVLGLILAFPLMISAVASSAPSPKSFFRGFTPGMPGMPVVAVETMLVGGLVFAGRERRRLLVEMDAARTRPSEVASLSSAMLVRSKAPARVSVFSLKR